MEPKFRTKPLRSPKYLAWVRSLPCCICGNPETVAHHAIAIGLGGIMGDKASDTMTMPVCALHHAEIHRDVNLYDQRHHVFVTREKAERAGLLGVL